MRVNSCGQASVQPSITQARTPIICNHKIGLIDQILSHTISFAQNITDTYRDNIPVYFVQCMDVPNGASDLLHLNSQFKCVIHPQ
jgi:hypothetical protein